jgi:hypothetical protein
VPEKTSNKVKKKVDEVKNKITGEEWDDDAERYRDSDDGQFTRGPKHKNNE